MDTREEGLPERIRMTPARFLRVIPPLLDGLAISISKDLPKLMEHRNALQNLRVPLHSEGDDFAETGAGRECA